MSGSAERGFRRRRSVLFVPASNPRALEKARGLPWDAVVLDLEDSVAPEMKAEARAAAVQALSAAFGGREVAVRCNGLDTPWGADDLAALARGGAGAAPDAVLAPKISGADDLAAYDRALAAAPASTRLWAMIETARGVLDLKEIAAASASTRLAALVLGPNDLSLDLRLRPAPGRAALVPILSALVVAARAHGLSALDGAYNDFENAAGFEAECRQGRDFGFDGKTLIHPTQIAAANRAFSPSADEIAWARAVVAAFAAPEAEGKGAIRLGGRMIERLHLVEAERTLRFAGMSSPM